jgi:hypothetical protein
MVLVLSNLAEDGLVWQGRITAEVYEEPLAVATIRALRQEGVEINDGDVLFFPDSAPKHRAAVIRGDEAFRIWGAP